MNDPSDKKLDALLKQWAKGREASADRLRQLGDRIFESVNSHSGESEPIPASLGRDLIPRPSRTPSRALWFITGVVATILVMSLYFRRLDVPSPASAPNADAALLAASELGGARLEHQAQLLAEMQRIFNGQLEWVADKPGKVQIGLADASAAPDLKASASSVTIRVVVAKRSRGERQWTVEWSTDIIARDERTMDLAIGAEGHLRMWTYCMPEGMIAVESEFEPSSQMPLEASFSAIQKDRMPQKVFETRVGDVEYQVIQTVAALGKVAT